MSGQAPTSGRSRLLALTAVPPWPMRDGYSVRAGHLLRELARSREITLLSPETPGAREAAAPEGVEWIRLPELPATNILPWRAERDQLVQETRRVLTREKYEVALLWNGTEYVAGEIHNFPPAIADRIDSEALQAWRSRKHRWWSYRRKLQELRRGIDQALYEWRELSRLFAIVATTPDDTRMLERISGHSRVRVVTNGVELPLPDEHPDEIEVPTVLFTGVLGFPPNIEAARFFGREVWPSVRRKMPEAQFVVAGRSPVPRNVAELERLPGIEIRPDVDVMTDEIRKAWVVVAPMRSGSGIKNKVLEAWASGRPVVMSERAAAGLHLGERAEDLVVNDPDRMARIVLDLLADESARARYGDTGRRLVAEHHSWENAVKPLVELIESARIDRNAG